jgi:hypothetical protein
MILPPADVPRIYSSGRKIIPAALEYVINYRQFQPGTVPPARVYRPILRESGAKNPFGILLFF